MFDDLISSSVVMYADCTGTSKWDEKDKHNRYDWNITIINKKTGNDFNVKFHTGEAHVKELTFPKKGSQPTKPGIKDVLSALLLDSDCGDQTFNNFCDDLGYSIDSRKAFEIYLECQKNGSKLKKCFSIKDIEAMRSELQDY